MWTENDLKTTAFLLANARFSGARDAQDAFEKALTKAYEAGRKAERRAQSEAKRSK